MTNKTSIMKTTVIVLALLGFTVLACSKSGHYASDWDKIERAREFESDVLLDQEIEVEEAFEERVDLGEYEEEFVESLELENFEEHPVDNLDFDEFEEESSDREQDSTEQSNEDLEEDPSQVCDFEEYNGVSEMEAIANCADAPAKYPNSWQMVSPLPLPIQIYSIFHQNGERYALGHIGGAVFVEDEEDSWKLLNKITADHLSLWTHDVAGTQERQCIPPGRNLGNSTCGIACWNSTTQCFDCLIPQADPLVPSQGLGLGSYQNHSMRVAHDHVVQLVDANGLERLETVISTGSDHSIPSRFFKEEQKIFGRVCDPDSCWPSLFELRDGEWIETQSLDRRLAYYGELGIGRPVEWHERVYLYTDARRYVDFAHTYDMAEGLLESIPFPLSITFGGVQLENFALVGGDDGHVARLDPDGGVTVTQELPGDVYQIINDQTSGEIWAAGSGFVASYDSQENAWSQPWAGRLWQRDFYSFFDVKVVDIAGPSSDRYFVLMREERFDGGIGEDTPHNGYKLFEVSGCLKREIEIPLIGTSDNELRMAWRDSSEEMEIGTLLLADLNWRQGRVLKLLADGTLEVASFHFQDWEIDVIAPSIHGEYLATAKVADGPYWELDRSLLRIAGCEVEEIAPLGTRYTTEAIVELNEGLVVVADHYGLSVLRIDKLTLERFPYPEDREVPLQLKVDMNLEEGDEHTVLVSGFADGFFSWSMENGFQWHGSESEPHYLLNVTRAGDCLHADEQWISCDDSVHWTQLVDLRAFLGSYFSSDRFLFEAAAGRIKRLGDRLFAFGHDQTILGFVPQGAFEPAEQCPSIEFEYPQEECEESCTVPQDLSETVTCDDTECWIPGGSFCLTTCKSANLSPYYIDKTEVTNQAYRGCVDASVCSPPAKQDLWGGKDGYYSHPDYNDFPVTYVTWEQAQTYCSYQGKRLPTEAEWQLAGTGYVRDSNVFAPCDRYSEEGIDECVSWGLNHSGPVGVQALPHGGHPLGVRGMRGNMSEWVADRWHPGFHWLTAGALDPIAPDENDVPSRAHWRVIKGGNWSGSRKHLVNVMNRTGNDPAYTTMIVGFRCARSAEVP